MNLLEGWKLVPVEPTEEMCRALSCAYSPDLLSKEQAGDLYALMLATAPTPPAPEVEPVGYIWREKWETSPYSWRFCHESSQVKDVTEKGIIEAQLVYTHPADDGLRKAAEKAMFALEPYDDLKPRDWVTDRERLRIAYTDLRAELDKR